MKLVLDPWQTRKIIRVDEPVEEENDVDGETCGGHCLSVSPKVMEKELVGMKGM